MKLDEVNENNYQQMKREVSKNEYKWEDIYLEEELQGCLLKERKLHNEYSGNELDEKQINENKAVDKINELIKNYNNSFENNEEITKKIVQLYTEIDCEKWMLNESNILEQLKFGKKILITGPGGIGKSQYIYSLYVNSRKLNYKKCFIYGKYSENITESDLEDIFSEIKKIAIKEKVLFVIDAINEFDIKKRKLIYDFLEENSKNIRIIITCRDFSLDDEEIKLIENKTEQQIPFSGVDSVDSIIKISEECNIDLTKYEEIIYDNNPLHLNIIRNVISNNRLENKEYNSIAIGTDIYEQYIKNTTGKYNIDKGKYWKETKTLIKWMVDQNCDVLKIENVEQILGNESSDYFKVMKQEGFIDINNNRIIFRAETLEAYLIVRTMFEILPSKEQDVIKFIDEKMSIFVFIYEQLIIMLFDKIQNMEKIKKIINKTKLKHYFGDIKFLNRIKFTKEKRKKFIKSFKCTGRIDDILFSAGGFENNPLSCVNYLNKIIFKENTDFDFKFSEVDIRYAKNHLVAWIRTVATFDCNNEYIKEKLWFSIWCLSISNKSIRYLARKLIYEIVQKNKNYLNCLFNIYYKVKDEYIKEGIIQIVCSQEKDNLKIKRFLNRINNEDLLNIQSLYYISNYLYNSEKYTCFNKHNLLQDENTRCKNKYIYQFLKQVLDIQREEFVLFGMDRHGTKIKYFEKFIKENKYKLNEINKYINKNWKCNEYCKYEDEFKNEIIYSKFGKINEEKLNDYDIYFAWQEVFKIELKKYNIKYKKLDKYFVYETESKNVVYKALEIANKKVAGSICCNYFSDQFKIDENKDNGYLEYSLKEHEEIIGLYSPITIFNEGIETLNNKIIRNVQIPHNSSEFNIEWAIDKGLSFKNFRNIIQPVKYAGKKWIMIYGSIKFKNSEYEDKWADDYIINLAINEGYTLRMNSTMDRKYTIETKRYIGNINDYYKENYTQSTSIEKSSFWNEYFIESDYNLPPSQIIREFNLKYNNLLSAWVNKDGKEVIKVSNNKDSWYRGGAIGTIFIDEDYYNILTTKYKMKYFAFTERFFKQYRDESALEIEYIDENNVFTYLHYTEGKEYEDEKCKECLIYKKGKEEEEKFKNIPWKFPLLLDEIWDDENIE